MAYLRFDKPAQVAVRGCLKETLLLPHLDAIKDLFRTAICGWDLMGANAVYRLLANRKSLLVHLDREAVGALVAKGREYVQPSPRDPDTGQHFVTLLGQFYNMTTELVQTALASRPELFEARSRALRTLLNGEGRQSRSFAAKSLAQCADYIVSAFPDGTGATPQMLNVIVSD